MQVQEAVSTPTNSQPATTNQVGKLCGRSVRCYNNMLGVIAISLIAIPTLVAMSIGIQDPVSGFDATITTWPFNWLACFALTFTLWKREAIAEPTQTSSQISVPNRTYKAIENFCGRHIRKIRAGLCFTAGTLSTLPPPFLLASRTPQDQLLTTLSYTWAATLSAVPLAILLMIANEFELRQSEKVNRPPV